MKRIIALIAALLVLVALLCLPVYAEENTSPSETPAFFESEVFPPDRTLEDDTVTQNIAEWLTEHFSDIVSAATGVAMIAFTWAFKKVVVPAVTKAIQSVAQRSEASEKNFSEGVESAVCLLESCGKYLEECSHTLDKTTEEMQKKLVAQSKAYELQTDLINYLVMNLRIPNDLKAEIAERSAAVKSAIEEARAE